MFYQKIAEISYNRAFLSFFGPGQDDLAAAFLVCDGQKFYWKMTIPAAIRFRTDSVVSLSKMIWGVNPASIK